MLPLAAAAAFALWRRAARRRPHVDLVYDDGSLVRLERGVEADSLLADATQLLDTLA